ncbi:MAG: S41 family peptidase [Ekhidna sp.]|uniref:S41 family peptidase n=1 Tax=Ekhidna sp. TaxID=2608089 RepID=UPI0032EB0184
MLKLIPLFALLACAQAQTLYDPQEVSEDISYLQQQQEDYHPGLYRYTAKEEMDEAFTNAKENSGLNDIGLYQRVNYLLAKVGCGHTRARMSDAMRSKFEREQTFMPLSVKFLGDKVYVRESLDERVKPGWEITHINDRPVNEIKGRVSQYLPGDGTIETGKMKYVELLFDAYYQLYIDSTATSYELDLITQDGEERAIQVEGTTIDQVNSIRESFSGDFLSLELNKDYGYMCIRTFSEGALRDNGYDFEQFLAESFKKLKESSTKNLVLDLRGNGGGKDDYGALLVSYLAQEPFGYFDRIEVTRKYPGRSKRVGDQYLMTSHNGLSTWQPKEDRFTGKLYVLTDGFSFSTCADVATVLHHHGWATFLGEETGGGYDGNTSGHTRTITLSNSDIIVNVPMWMYTTANVGHAYKGRGVIPDYLVIPTWDEYNGGLDVVMEKVEELIGKN